MLSGVARERGVWCAVWTTVLAAIGATPGAGFGAAIGPAAVGALATAATRTGVVTRAFIRAARRTLDAGGADGAHGPLRARRAGLAICTVGAVGAGARCNGSTESHRYQHQ